MTPASPRSRGLLLLLAAVALAAGGARAALDRTDEVNLHTGPYTPSNSYQIAADGSPTSTFVDGTTGLTWSIWLRATSRVAAWSSFFGRATSRAPSFFVYGEGNSDVAHRGTLHLRSAVASVSNAGVDTLTRIDLNVDNHIVITHKAGEFKVYLNGVPELFDNQILSNDGTVIHAPITADDDFRGASETFTGTPGTARDVRFWPRVLSADDVAELHADGFAEAPPSIVTGPSDVEADLGDAVELSCKAGGLPYPDLVQWRKDGVLTGDTGTVLSIASLDASHLGSYTCAASIGGGAEAESAPAEVSLACAGVDVPTALDEGASGIGAGGDLEVAFLVDADRYSSAASIRFVDDADGACDVSGALGGGGVTSDDGTWRHELSGCGVRHTIHMATPELLSQCNFAGPSEAGDFFEYEATAEVTTNEVTGSVFGAPATRTETSAVRVVVRVPRAAQVDTTAVAWNSVIELGLLSSQASDPTSKLFTWEFATSVQEPYYLEAVSAAASPSGDFDDVAPAVSGTDVCSGVTGTCTQTFTVTATAGALVCEIDGTATLTFAVRCRDNFDGACDLALVAAETTQLSFSYLTDSFCARVAEVAQVTPELVTSTSKGGAPASDFVLQTTLHGRVSLAVEGGVAVSRVHLAQLDIASEATVRAVENGGYAGSSDTKFLMSTADQVDGAAHVDFSFQLNTESVSFSAGGATGQATVTLTAVVEVTYADATLQRFTVETQAAAPATAAVVSQATIGVTSTPAAGGSSSTAGSTVLGVSTGTAMVAGVGLVAVVALAAGAAVAVRKRRQSAARRLKPASSSVELNDTAAVQV